MGAEAWLPMQEELSTQTGPGPPFTHIRKQLYNAEVYNRSSGQNHPKNCRPPDEESSHSEIGRCIQLQSDFHFLPYLKNLEHLSNP